MFSTIKRKMGGVFGHLVKYMGDDKFAHWPADNVSPASLARLKKSIESGRLDEWEQLLMAITEKWPEYLRNTDSVSGAVSRMQWTVMPWAEDGKKPTPEAQEYASLVSSVFWRNEVSATKFEVEGRKLIKLLCFAKWNGSAVLEIRWGSDGKTVYPAAYVPVTAKHYAWPYSMSHEDELLFFPDGIDMMGSEEGVPFPRDKFIVGLNKSTCFHPIYNSTARVLVGYFGAAVWGLAWYMSYCEKFGRPFMHATANSASDAKEAMRMLEQMGQGGIAVSTKDFDVKFMESMKGDKSIPQASLLDRADEQCVKLIAGQTLTSNSGEGVGGSYALGKVHEGIRQEVLLDVAGEVADILNSQLVKSILKLNYGKLPDNLPYFVPAIPGDKENNEKVDFYDGVINRIGLPVSREYLYDSFGIPQPEEGDDVVGKFPEPDPWEDEITAAARVRGKLMRRA